MLKFALFLLTINGIALTSETVSATESNDKLAAFLGVETGDLTRPGKFAPNLSFQTASRYDERIDLRADEVIVHVHGQSAENAKATFESWQTAGHEVISMFFVASDAGQHFEQGRVTGEPRPDVPELTADGHVLRVEGHRAYMFPDSDWVAYVEGLIERSIKNGAVGIMPEEPFGHAQTGYEDAYKRMWTKATGEPWVAPHHDIETFWRSARFKGDTFHAMIARLAARTHELAEAEGRDVRFILPIHSILSNMAGGRIFPNVASLGIEHLDGYIAQVWQGPVLWALGNLEGERYDGFFESALGLYGTFAELSRNTGKEMHFLVDPVEDDPNRTWETYQRNYQMCVVAMLHYPWVNRYEVMPWPDRIFLPGFRTGSGTPGPADYLTQLMGVMRAFDEMPRFDAAPSPNDQGVGLFIADTASWEIHGPQGSGMEAFHGLYLPLTTRGVMVRLPWLERAAEPGYLAPFNVLALSYDNQKPLDESVHDGLLAWVRDGGHLVVFGGDSPYNAVDGWWREKGYDDPVAALLGSAGSTGVTFARKSLKLISVRGGDEHGLPGSPNIRVYQNPPGEALAMGPNGEIVGFSISLGAGAFHVVGTPASLAAEQKGGADFVFDLMQKVSEKAGNGLRPRDVFRMTRGPYETAYALRGSHPVTGTFIDLFDPMYPVVNDPVVSEGEAGLFFRIPALGDDPAVLFATHRLVYSDTTADSARLVMEGPSGTLGAARIASPKGKNRISVAEAIDATGATVPVLHKYDADQRSSLVQFPYHPNGVALRIVWD